MSCWHHIQNDTQASVSVITAVVFVVLCLCSGLAIDHSRALGNKFALQDAADAATIAAAVALQNNPNLTRSEVSALAQQFFQSNAGKNAHPSTTRVNFDIDQETVTTRLTNSIPTSLMALAGIDSLTVSVTSSANIQPLRAEVVFVLDNSSSMSGSEHSAMIGAVQQMIDQITRSKTNQEVKIGLVPFAKYVRVSLPGEQVLSGSAGSVWTNCTGDRRWPYNTQNSLPMGSESGSLWGRTDGDDTIDADEYDDCDATTPESLVVRPLSNNHVTTEEHLLGQEAGSGTNLFVGLQFGWHLLTSGNFGTEAAAFGQLKKYMVLLTDGRQNKNSFGEDGSFSEENALQNMQTVCTNAKSMGVSIIAVAYDLDDAEGKQDLRSCASSSEHYLEGTSVTIEQVFRDIGTAMLKKTIALVR